MVYASAVLVSRKKIVNLLYFGLCQYFGVVRDNHPVTYCHGAFTLFGKSKAR